MVKKASLLLLFFTSSCGYINDKIGDYYLSKAKHISSKKEVSEKEVKRFYDYVTKAVEKNKTDPSIIELVDKVTDASVKSGYFKAYEYQLMFYKRYIDINPFAWNVYLNLINIFALKGDIQSLNSMDFEFEKKAFDKIEFHLLSFIAKTNMLYWFETYGYLSVNDDYSVMFDYLTRYCELWKRMNEIIILDKQGFFKNSDPHLYYYFATNKHDIIEKRLQIANTCELHMKIVSNKEYSDMLKHYIKANNYLSKKEYNNAVLYYKAAITIDDNFIEAKKGLIEAEFQNAITMSLMKRNSSDVVSFVSRRLRDIDNLILDISSSKISFKVPFLNTNKFISSVYALKAAMISVLYDNDNKNKEVYLNDIRIAISEALKYDPSNKFVKELSERFFKQ